MVRLQPRLCENSRVPCCGGRATLFSLNVAQGVALFVSRWQLHSGCVEKSNRTSEFSHTLSQEQTFNVLVNSGQKLSPDVA